MAKSVNFQDYTYSEYSTSEVNLLISIMTSVETSLDFDYNIQELTENSYWRVLDLLQRGRDFKAINPKGE